MKWLQIMLAGTVLLLAAPNAIGADVEIKVRAAKRACLVGDIEKGIGILADLYVDTNDATYLFNQGRCFEQNGKNEQAVLRFKEYLRKAKNLSQDNSDAVMKKISELQSAAGQHEVQPPPASSTASPAQPIAVLASAAPPTSGAAQFAPVALAPDSLNISQSGPPLEPQESPPVYKRWWFWTGIGAVVVGGVVTGMLLSKKSAATRPTCDAGFACAP